MAAYPLTIPCLKHISVRNCSFFVLLRGVCLFVCLYISPVCSEGAIWQRTSIGWWDPFWRFNLHVVRFRQMDCCPVVCLSNQTKQLCTKNLPASMPSLLVENWQPGKGQRYSLPPTCKYKGKRYMDKIKKKSLPLKGECLVWWCLILHMVWRMSSVVNVV